MKKKPNRVRVDGQLDSLTDLLKLFLNQDAGLSVDDLMVRVARRLVTNQKAAKLKKHIYRCLEKNPCFYQDENDTWHLDLGGLEENDPVYDWLQSSAQALTIYDLRTIAEEEGVDPASFTEKSLVGDGRFLRLRDGRWSLINWEVVRSVTAQEMEKMASLIRGANKPLTIDELARSVIKVGVEGTDLVLALQKDARFFWVGGRYWFLRELVPRMPAPKPQAPWWEMELAVLQEAELMLILNDTNPNVRDYVVSSQDILAGTLRITKRMERLFSGLPPVAWITFQTPSGAFDCWYLRDGGLVTGLDQWFRVENLEPGTIIRLEQITGEERLFLLKNTGEREAEVHAEGARSLVLNNLANQNNPPPVPQLLERVLELYPSGLAEEELFRILSHIRPELQYDELKNLLASKPFYHRSSDGLWGIHEGLRQAYIQMMDEVARANELVLAAQREAAATAEEARALLAQKEGLKGELIYLQNHHRERESQLQEEISRLRDYIVDLEQENSHLKVELEKLRYRREQILEETKDELDQQRRECESWRQKAHQAEARVAQLQGTLHRTLEEAEKEQARLSQRVRELEARLTSALAANDELHRTVARLQEDRRELRKMLSPWVVRMALFIWRIFHRRGDPVL